MSSSDARGGEGSSPSRDQQMLDFDGRRDGAWYLVLLIRCSGSSSRRPTIWANSASAYHCCGSSGASSVASCWQMNAAGHATLATAIGPPNRAAVALCFRAPRDPQQAVGDGLIEPCRASACAACRQRLDHGQNLLASSRAVAVPPRSAPLSDSSDGVDFARRRKPGSPRLVPSSIAGSTSRTASAFRWAARGEVAKAQLQQATFLRAVRCGRNEVSSKATAHGVRLLHCQARYFAGLACPSPSPSTLAFAPFPSSFCLALTTVALAIAVASSPCRRRDVVGH